jgi:hypothetical protein
VPALTTTTHEVTVVIIAGAEATTSAEIDLSGMLAALGPEGLAVVLALAGLLLLRSKTVRSALRRATAATLRRAGRAVVRWVRISLWATLLRMPIRLAYRLQRERWREMCAARKLVGLRRGRVRRTPMGVDVRVTLGGSLTLETLNARIRDLETGLGTRRGAIRIEPRDSAHKATVRITVRNPLARAVRWQAPDGPVSITAPARLSMNPFGEWADVDLQQRILIVGASGSGKSSVQRVLAAPVILADDAQLEVWDLKQGTESQHYEGKADVRVTDIEQCRQRIRHLMDVELPYRAAVMKRLGTSTWPTSPEHPDRIVMVDEGAALIRGLDDDELAELFTFLEQARAFGIYLWWATQFPKSSNLPTELRSQMSCIIALKMRRASESRIVFEDLVREGWTPHRLAGKGWLMVLDDDHDEPEETRAAWLDERVFRQLPAPRPRPADPAPAPPQPRVTLEKPAVAAPTPAPVARVAEPAPEAADARTAVLGALEAAPEAGVSVAELQAATGLSKSRVYELLAELLKAGDAVKVRHGRFAAREEAAA